MTQISCTRMIGFDAGHRVLGHEGKCANPHGHRYTAEITAVADIDHTGDRLPALDEIGRVIDFSVLKDKVGGWIDRHWDHGFIIFDEDYQLQKGLRLLTAPEAKVFYAPFNPTAENMAAYLLNDVCPEVLDGTGVRVTEIKLWETPNCFAVAREIN